MSKYNIVYKTTNKINGMIYIGRHSTNKLEDGYLGSGKLLKKAIVEFGKENFVREILFVYDNKEEMFIKEIELVNDAFRSRKDTYNWALGSDSWGMLGIKLEPRSDEYIKKQQLAQKGKHSKPLLPEHREKVIKTLQPMVKGRFTHSDEQKQKWSMERTGRTHSDETIKKLTELNLGENNPNFGKQASKETRQKMSESGKGKKRSPRAFEHTEKLRQANLGLIRGPQSEEHKQKLRDAKLGKPKSEETKEKIRQTNLRKSFEKKMNIINLIMFLIIKNK